MTEARKRSVLATMVFIGSILGAGVFGLPYAFAKSGWLIGFFDLVVIGVFVLLLQLMYAEITIQTPGRRRMTGLAGLYLGSSWRYVTTFLFFGLGWGVLTAYVILAGGFLTDLLQPLFGGDLFVYGLVFLGIEGLLLCASLKRAAHFELLVGSVLLILFVVLLLSGLPFLQSAYLGTVALEHAFSPYGVILFSIAGLGVMPEMHDVFGEKYEYRMSKSVIHGFLILLLLYTLFTFVVVGVTGPLTTEDALTGYTPLLGPGMEAFGAFVGVLTIGSIFMMMGEQMKDTFIFDFSLSKRTAWVLTLLVPVVLFVVGVRDFISVISFTGSVFVALLACIVLLIYHRMQKGVCRSTRCFTVPRWISVCIGLLFLFGALREIINLFL